MEKTVRCPRCGASFKISNPDTSHIIVGKHGIANLGQNDVTTNTNLANQAQKDREIREWLQREGQRVLQPSEGYSNLKAHEEGIGHEEQVKEDQRKKGFV